MMKEDGKEKIAGILALIGALIVFGEVLYHIYIYMVWHQPGDVYNRFFINGSISRVNK